MSQVQLQPPASGELRFAVAESSNPVLSRAVSECVQVGGDATRLQFSIMSALPMCLLQPVTSCALGTGDILPVK